MSPSTPRAKAATERIARLDRPPPMPTPDRPGSRTAFQQFLDATPGRPIPRVPHAARRYLRVGYAMPLPRRRHRLGHGKLAECPAQVDFVASPALLLVGSSQTRRTRATPRSWASRGFDFARRCAYHSRCRPNWRRPASALLFSERRDILGRVRAPIRASQLNSIHTSTMRMTITAGTTNSCRMNRAAKDRSAHLFAQEGPRPEPRLSRPELRWQPHHPPRPRHYAFRHLAGNGSAAGQAQRRGGCQVAGQVPVAGPSIKGLSFPRFRDSGNFVRLLSGLDLTQNHPTLKRPCTHHVDGRFVLFVGAAQCLPVNCNNPFRC